MFVTGTCEVRQVLNWNQPRCKFRYFYWPFLTTSQDNFRIYEFVYRDPHFTPHGKIFYRDLTVPQRYLPSADLLRHHFRQCVLTNVKGTGEFDEEPDHQGGFNLSTKSWSTSQDGQQFEPIEPVMGVLEASELPSQVNVGLAA